MPLTRGGPGAAAAGAGADDAALVRAGWTPGRAESDHRSEMVTQWLCGEVLAVESTAAGGEWLRVRGPDGYRCWVAAGGVVLTDAARAGRWAEVADHLSLDVPLDGEGGAPSPRRLPWGARVSYDDGLVGLPDGATARAAAPDRLVAFDRLEERFPARAEALAETALAWRGAPYLWGGRTPDGVDCSGYVQAVFGLHGVELPRDSGDQLEATVEALVAGSGGADDGRAVDVDGTDASASDVGDLLFFRGAGDAITHVAVSLGGGEVVHAASGRGGVAVDDLAGSEPLCRELADRLVAVTRPFSLRGRRRRSPSPPRA